MKYSEALTGKLFRYFDDNLRLKESTKGFLRGDCPLCSGKFTFGINLERGKSNCFICEQGKTNLINLVRVMQNFDKMSEAIQYLNLQDDYEYAFNFARGKPVDTEVKPMELPDGYHALTEGDDRYATTARRYLTKTRGLSLSTLTSAGVGYCDKGKYSGYIIIPYFSLGRLIYFSGRLYLGAGTKFKNPSEAEYGFGKNQIIYNSDGLFMYEKTYLVESSMNALTMGPAAVGLSGKTISTYQFSYLLKSPCERVVIGLDPDALKEAYALALKLCPYKRVKVLELPEGTDINSLGRKETRIIEQNTPYLDYQGFYKKYLKHK